MTMHSGYILQGLTNYITVNESMCEIFFYFRTNALVAREIFSLMVISIEAYDRKPKLHTYYCRVLGINGDWNGHNIRFIVFV